MRGERRVVRGKRRGGVIKGERRGGVVRGREGWCS